MAEILSGCIGEQTGSSTVTSGSDANRKTYTEEDEDITFYNCSVPDFAEAELERLYSSVMSTWARYSIYESAPDASTYIVERGGIVRTLLLFRKNEKNIKVYNEQITLTQSEIADFVRRVLAVYPSVSRVSFYAIDSDISALSYPHVVRECLEDIMLKLPDTEDEYVKRLGHNTRAGIRRSHRQLLRDHPTFRFDVSVRDAVNERQIREIICFAEARMCVKKQVSYHTEETTNKLIKMTRKYGVVGIATIDGIMYAGMIGYRLGADYFLEVGAHDPTMDKYRLGTVCNYLSILDAITRGVRQYHFGWGPCDYKYRLLGKHKKLYRLEIYRTGLEKYLDIRYLTYSFLVTEKRKLKIMMRHIENSATEPNRKIARLINTMRIVKHFVKSKIYSIKNI